VIFFCLGLRRMIKIDFREVERLKLKKMRLRPKWQNLAMRRVCDAAQWAGDPVRLLLSRPPSPQPVLYQPLAARWVQ
jgi:hypothetical protein